MANSCELLPGQSRSSPHSATTLVTPSNLAEKDTQYNTKIPSIVGMNIIREFSMRCKSKGHGNVPKEWNLAFGVLMCPSIGTVKLNKDLILQPMEIKTITGFVRKSSEIDSAVTEDIDNSRPDKPTVCPRVVRLSNPGKTARIPVRVCNLSAKVVKIKARSPICSLQEISILRSTPLFENERPTCSKPMENEN